MPLVTSPDLLPRNLSRIAEGCPRISSAYDAGLLDSSMDMHLQDHGVMGRVRTGVES